MPDSVTEPWLSVAMPVHCGGAYLHATLASVAAAKPDGVEFLVYDSSPDEACRSIADAHSDVLNLRYIAMPDVPGWPDKTNLAVQHASAPYVAMLHQDDLWLPGHVEAIRTSIAIAPEALMHVAASRLIDANGHDIGQWKPPLAPGIQTGEAFGRSLIVQNFLAIPSPIILRDAWLATEGLDPALWYTADWDLYLKLARRGAIMVRPQATTAFRVHGSSLTMTGSRDAIALRQQFDIVLDRHGAALGMEHDSRLRARVMTSVAINCGLAAAAAGESKALWSALRRFLTLGPHDALRYIRESRIIERVLPRLRAKIVGVL